MTTQEQQEQKHGFYIHSTMEVKVKDEKTRELTKQDVITHLSWEIVVPGKDPIIKGYFPKDDHIKDSKNKNTFKSLFVEVDGEYRDDAERLELAREWDARYPNDKASYTKKIPFTDEEVLKVYNFVEAKQKNPGKYHLQSWNCVHDLNEAYQGSGRQGSFTDHYTSEEMAQKMPGLTMSGIGRAFMAGSFFPGDKPLTVLGESVKDVAEKYNVPESRVSQRESIPGVPDADLAIEQEAANQFTFVIAPNPELVASAASEVRQIDEHLAQLAVTEDEGLQEYMGLFEIIAKTIGSPIKLFHSSKNTKILDCGVDEKGKLIEILFDYNNNAQWTCADEEMWFPKSDPSNFQPFTTKNIYEAIAHTTEGRYTAQDLIELQRSNFQAINDTYQGSIMASDGNKKPAFEHNTTPSTASDSEEEQQHSVQQNTAPLDPEYEDYLIGSKAMMASFPFLLQQIEERSGLYSYESWKKAHDLGREIAKTSKVKSIIEAALKAFKEKFEAIRDKFTKKLQDDIEKTAKDASDSQQNGQAEYDAKAKAIHQQKAQEIDAMRGQLQSSYESQVAAIAERKKGECAAFFQQKQSEHDSEFAMEQIGAQNSVNASSMGASVFIDSGHIAQRKNAEINAFNAQKSAEMQKEQQALLAQTQNQLNSFIASKEAEAEQKCNALKSSIEQRLKSTESKVREIAEAAQTKQTTQVAKCNKKIKDIQEDTTGLIERLKEVVGNSGDAEALINKELNVFLQGAASDFGVDAEIL